jgi:undecaprenyl-diphosphatase
VHRSEIVAAVVRRWRRFLGTSAMQRLKARHPRIWTFVARRFARGEYLGLHLTIGLAISLGALWLFAGLTEDVVRHDSITRFDLSLLAWLRAHFGSSHRVARAISLLGSPLVLIPLGVSIAGILALKRHWLLLEGWVVSLLGGALLNGLLKHAVHRPRPIHSEILSSQSWSFPSGHAMVSLIAYGMLAYLFFVLAPHDRRRVIIVLGAGCLVLAIGLSRLFLGAHYFSDVIGGYAAGVLWLSACISGLEVSRRWPAT